MVRRGRGRQQHHGPAEPDLGISCCSSTGHKGPAGAQASPDHCCWLLPALGSDSFATHSLAVWAAVGGTIQGRREEDSEDPEVLCPGQAPGQTAAFLHFRSTREIAQNPAALDSQGVKGRPQLPYL